jgi:hypothetical protein
MTARLLGLPVVRGFREHELRAANLSESSAYYSLTSNAARL